MKPGQVSNTEFLQHLMDFSTSGPLMHGFVLWALWKYAHEVQEMSEEDKAKMEEELVSYTAWSRCAREVITKLEERGFKSDG